MGKKDKKSKKMKNKTKPAPRPEPPPASGNTKFRLPGISYECSNEPVWVKVLLYLVTLGAMVAVLCIIHHWLMNVLASGAILNNLNSLVKTIKGKDG